MFKRIAILPAAVILAGLLLAGCGGGGSTTSPMDGTFKAVTARAVATRAAGDTMYVTLNVNGAVVTGTAELIPADGGQAVTSQLSSTSLVQGTLGFTAVFNSTNYVFSGTLSGTTLSGTLKIGANAADQTSFTRISETAASTISGSWTGTATETSGSNLGASTLSVTITQTAGSQSFTATGSQSISGTAVTFTATGTVFGTDFQMVASDSTGTSIWTGTYNGTTLAGSFGESGSGSAGTFTLSKPSTGGGGSTTRSIVALASFNGTLGVYPGDLIADGAGNLYGTCADGKDVNGTITQVGNGTIFKYSAAGGLQLLATFSGANGSYPDVTALYIDGAGNLYGTTDLAGTYNNGVIWKYSGNIQDLASFPAPPGGGSGDSGAWPTGFVADSSGNLYGVTDNGGDYGSGSIFEYSASNGTIQTLYSFTGGNDGGEFGGPLVTDGAGNFYGATFKGGANGDGTIFKFTVAGGLQTLATFSGANGKGPRGVIIDGAGNLYGATQSGGTNGLGTIFKYSAAGGLQVLAQVPNGNGFIMGRLVLDAKGNLYGAYSGATSDATMASNGAIFMYSASGGLQTLASFNGSNGTAPIGTMVIDSAGDLFGATYAGGAHSDGVIYELPAAGKSALIHK
jgi:uncharacterized repeat protein (TIGR03803 family)